MRFLRSTGRPTMIVIVLTLLLGVGFGGGVGAVALLAGDREVATSDPTAPAGPLRRDANAPTPSPSAPVSTAGSTAPGADVAYPDASRTGVPAGTVLSPYTGPMTISEAGTVIDGKIVDGCLVIKADDVTITRSLIKAPCLFNVLSDAGNTGLVLSDVEIDGSNSASNDSAVSGSNYSCLRCNVHGTVDGFKAGNEVVIQSSYVHDLTLTGDSHNDGIQSLGTTKMVIEDNTIIVGEGATAAIILSTNSAEFMRNVTIRRNLLGGGAFTIYGGYQAGADAPEKISDIAIVDNHFTTEVFPHSGAYGPLTSADSPVVVAGNTWYDGPEAGRAVS